MSGGPPEVRYLTRGWERGLGAMFRRGLDGEILVFVYQRPAAHLFHTFFSPRLRMLALDDEGSPLFDAIVTPNRVVPLPASRLVVECDPAQELARDDASAFPSAEFTPSLALSDGEAGAEGLRVGLRAGLAAIAAAAPLPGLPGKGVRPWTG